MSCYIKENTLPLEKIKVEPPESPLNNDNNLCDASFESESHSSGATGIKKEMEINYETCDGESETLRLNSEIKREYEETNLKIELMSDTNETSDVESFKSNIRGIKKEMEINYETCDGDSEMFRLDSEIKIEHEETDLKIELKSETNETSNIRGFENIFVQSTEELVGVKEENQELIEDPLREVAGEEADKGRGYVEVINRSETEKPICVEKNVDSHSTMLILTEKKIHAAKIPPGEKSHKCGICGKLFALKGHRNEHMLIHTDEKPYRCDICGKSFQRIGKLNRHKLIHTDEKPHKCDVCGKLCREKIDLKKHSLIHTDEKPHRCDICGKSFKRKDQLNRHKLIHTDEKLHKCDVCGILFRDKMQLKRHSSIHTGEKPHGCDVCGKLFRQIQYLNIHKLIHTGEKPHRCDVCGKLFNQMSCLRRHMLIHTGEKPHKCEICGELFREKVQLKRHSSKHSGEKNH